MENEYNKRFKNKEMSNDDFDVEGLWDNIADELDESAKSSLFPWTKLTGGLFLLLLATVCFILLNSSDDILPEKSISSTRNEKVESKETAKDLNANSLKSVDNRTDNTSTQKEETPSDFPNQNLTIKTDNQSSPSTNKHNSSIPNNTNVSLNNAPTTSLKGNKSIIKGGKNIEISTKEVRSGELTKTGIQETILTEKSNIQNSTDSSNSTIKGSEKNTPNLKKFIVLVSPLPKTGIDNLADFTPIISDSLLYLNIREIPQKKVKEDAGTEKKIAFEASILGGINSTFVNFTSTSDATYAEQRNQNENQVIGSTYGVQLGLLYKGWRANTGIELHNIWTKLDTQINIDTSSVFVPQALSLVRIDSTGNVLGREFRDTMVNASTTRTILHHNNFQMLRIPLEIGRYRTHKKWAYGFSAGTSFNFLIDQSGKILDSNNNLLEFTKDTDKVLFPAFSMSLRANVMLGYKIKENILVSLSPQWSWTQSNLFDNSLKVNAHQTNLILSLRTLF